LMQEAFEKLAELAYDYKPTFVSDARALLSNFHARASHLGRQASAGSAIGASDADVWLGDLAAWKELPYLHKFDAWLRSGTEGREKQIEARSRLYTGKLRGTANEAYFEDQPPMKVKWVLGSIENHCQSCIELAAGGPYDSRNVPTYPGAGDTECGGNCDCSLEPEGGASPF
jgi:hypothetical protein